jgi:hypothetical protein
MAASKGWIETPCKVIWSHVRSHQSDDGTTYSVDIFYEYQFDGETHRSNNYGFFGGSSSGHAGKKEVVDQYPRGSDQVCFVNPNLPEEAVLKPGWSWSAFLALFPLVFGGVGLLVLIASFRSGRKTAASSALASGQSGSLRDETISPFQSSPVATDMAPRTLSPGKKRVATAFGCLFMALFWNGIVSVFVYQVIQGFKRGNPEWFLTIFMIPFVLIGIGLILGFFYQLLSLANPKPVITINPGVVRLGEPFSVGWLLRGSASRVTSLKLSIHGMEAATYRQGTNTHTSTEIFYAEEFAAVSHLLEVQKGEAKVTIPADLMYSFEMSNNKIKYELRVNGDIPIWPDIQDSYELTVLPKTAD